MFALKLLMFLTFTFGILLKQIENSTVFGIGTRILGDQLLVKDVLQARSISEPNPSIGFNYAIPEPVTYIEILSEANVSAEVQISYVHKIVRGMVESTKKSKKPYTKPFEVEIYIYGFNDTIKSLHPSHVLNRDQHFKGVLEPRIPDAEESEEQTEEGLVRKIKSEKHDPISEEDLSTLWDDIEVGLQEKDKILQLGHRQKGDYLLYDTFQTSSKFTKKPSEHSVVFYYIDSNYVTYVKFVIFDYFVNKNALHAKSPTAEYTHFSPSSLKAVIKDENTTSLFVHMFLFGFNPKDVPVDYVAFLERTDAPVIDGDTDSPIALVEMRLKSLLKAKQQAWEDSTAIADSPISIDNSSYDNSSSSAMRISSAFAFPLTAVLIGLVEFRFCANFYCFIFSI